MDKRKPAITVTGALGAVHVDSYEDPASCVPYYFFWPTLAAKWLQVGWSGRGNQHEDQVQVDASSCLPLEYHHDPDDAPSVIFGE